MRWLLNTPYVPLIAWTLLIAVLVQVYKLGTRAAGIRHHPVVERTLPIVSIALGALTGLIFPETLGLPAIVEGDDVPRTLGALYGVGIGFVSSGAFKAVREALPESVAKRLTVSDQEAPSRA